MKQAGHDITVFDINAERISNEIVEKYINYSQGCFDLYCISGIVTTYNYQKWLIRMIKSYSDKPIVCGGGCATVAGNSLLNAGASEIIEGAGENKILSYLKSSLKYTNIDDIPFPHWESFNMETYLKNPIWGKETGNSSNVDIHSDMKGVKRSMNVITSRGCPFSCYFCYDLYGKNYQQRSVDNVIAELKTLKKNYNVDFIGFVDDNMFVNKEWVMEFCKEMYYLNLLWGCHARVNEVDKDILSYAYASGCRWIGYGIESGSQTMLNLMNKKTTVEQNKKAIIMTRDAKIYPNCSFIYGYTGENEKTVNETIDFCKSVNIQPSFFHAIPYPGSKFYRDNELKIMRKFNGFENFVTKLGDAKNFVINLTGMSDNKYFKLKDYLEKEVASG